MSNFFKLFQSKNQEPQGDEKKKDDGSQTPHSMLESVQELSLFSGMTFSSAISPSSCDQHKQPTSAQYSKPASKELEEARLHLSFKEPLIQNTEQTTKQKLLPTKASSKIDEQNDSSQPTQLSTSSVVQPQGKKKKKTQSKRPGYARDSKPTSSPQKAAVKPAVSDKQQLPTETKQTPSTLTDSPLTTQEAKDNSSEEQKVDSKDEEIVDQTHQEELSMSRNKNITEEVNNTAVEEENSRKDFQQLYSIGTPSSSEENLAEVFKQGQDEKKLQWQQENHEEESENFHREEEEEEDILDRVDGNHDDEKLANSEEDGKEDLVFNPRPEAITSQEKLDNIEDEENELVVKEHSIKEDKCSVLEAQVKSRTYDLKLDVEDKLILVEQDMTFRISSLSEDKDILSELKKYLLQNYSNSQRTYLEKQRELDNLIKEESNALANDNYDLVEELGVKIELAKDDLENAKYKFPGEDNKVQEAIKLASDLAFRTLSIHREAQSSLEQLREKQVAVTDNDHEACNSRISKEKQQLASENQRLDRARAHLQLDIEHLEKEEILIEDEISGRTAEFNNRKKDLTMQREQIREEIAELEQRLLQLRLKESQCSEEITAEELKIEEVVEEFLPQREPLNDQRIDLDNHRLLLHTQQEALTSAQEAFNKSMEEWHERKTRLSTFLASIQASVDSNNMSISLLEQTCGEMEDFQCLKHLSLNSDAALDKLKLSAKRSNQQIKNLKSKLNLSNRNIASLRKRLTEIEAQISDINEAKDIAKKERNFKEAKRLKEESESLNSEGVESQKKLENILEELHNDTSSLKNAEKDFGKITEELKEKEHDADSKLVKSAAQVVRGLETQLHRFKDNEMLYILVTAEISMCQNLIKELSSKHDISVPDLEEMTGRLGSDPEYESSEEDIETTCSDDGAAECEDIQDDKEDLRVLLEELEEQLEEVVEIEDFDEAERILQQIDELRSRLE